MRTRRAGDGRHLSAMADVSQVPTLELNKEQDTKWMNVPRINDGGRPIAEGIPVPKFPHRLRSKAALLSSLILFPFQGEPPTQPSSTFAHTTQKGWALS